jgi:hypothetical protein
MSIDFFIFLIFWTVTSFLNPGQHPCYAQFIGKFCAAESGRKRSINSKKSRTLHINHRSTKQQTATGQYFLNDFTSLMEPQFYAAAYLRPP